MAETKTMTLLEKAQSVQQRRNVVTNAEGTDLSVAYIKGEVGLIQLTRAIGVKHTSSSNSFVLRNLRHAFSEGRLEIAHKATRKPWKSQ